MIVLILLALVLILFFVRERYVDPESPVSRPTDNAVWRSKIDAQIPIGGERDQYIKVLQLFYDSVYTPAQVKPTDKDVETFLKRSDVNLPGIDISALRNIIGSSFRTERTITGAAREEKQVKFQPSEALQPQMGVDQVYNRTEELYVPADTREGELPEGIYEDVKQQDTPRREGLPTKKNEVSWTDTAFFNVCKEGPCEQNIT